MIAFAAAADTQAGCLCFECGSPSETNHHVVPKSRGGQMTVPLCGACHGKAHHSFRNMETATLTRAALHRLRAAGKRTGCIPYGYQLTDDTKTLVPVSAEQVVIQKIMACHESGVSLRKIAKVLSDNAILTKQGKKFWHPTTVNGVICRQKAIAEKAIE